MARQMGIGQVVRRHSGTGRACSRLLFPVKRGDGAAMQGNVDIRVFWRDRHLSEFLGRGKAMSRADMEKLARMLDGVLTR